MADMKQHVKMFHNNVSDTHQSEGVFNVILTGLSPAHHYRKAVFISGELFYVYWRIEREKFYCSVLYVGEDEEASKYKYKFTLMTECGDRKISMFFPTRCILENVEQLLDSGDCVILNYNTVLKFLNSKMHLECEFQISATEINVDITDGTSEQNLSAESGVLTSLLGRSRRHHRIRRHGREYSHGSPDKHLSVRKLRRCDHGKRFSRCASCRYSTPTSYTSECASTSGTHSHQNIQSPTGFYCAPSGDFTENASAEKCNIFPTVSPSAPIENHLYPDTEGKFSSNLSNDKKLYDNEYGYSGTRLSEGNSRSVSDDLVRWYPPSESTWKCTICEQIVPRFPNSFPDPGWKVTDVPVGTKWKCKMCGQIRQ
jgi:hypothetical protein